MYNFCVKRFHITRRLRLCFFFLWKHLKKYIWARKVFWFQVLGWFFMFLEALVWFNKALRVFTRCFWQKMSWNEFLDGKNHGPYFSTTIMVGFWDLKRCIIFLLKNTFKKKLVWLTCNFLNIFYLDEIFVFIMFLNICLL